MVNCLGGGALLLSACSGSGAKVNPLALHRVAWEGAQDLGDGEFGAEAWQELLPDSSGRFFAFGMDGAGVECTSLYPEADTDTLTGEVQCTPFTVDGGPDVYGAVQLAAHRVLVGSLDGDGWIGVQEVPGDVEAITASRTYDDVTALYDVARFGTDGFIAVGQSGKIVTTAPLNATGAPYTQQQLDPDEAEWVEVDLIAEGLMPAETVLPSLRAVTRLGPGNVIVGDSNADNDDLAAVWVFRPRPPDPAGDLGAWRAWSPMEVSETEGLNLYGVTVDEVHDDLRKDPTHPVSGDRVNDHRGFVLACGNGGKAYRFEVRLTDAEAGSDLDDDERFEPWTHASRTWGAGAWVFYDAWTDERTRTLVGDDGASTSAARDGVVITLARSEDFATSDLWLDRSPPAVGHTRLTGVVSNGSDYIAVGIKTNNQHGVLYAGHEAVEQCSVRPVSISAGTNRAYLNGCLDNFDHEIVSFDAYDIDVDTDTDVDTDAQTKIGDGLVALTDGGEMTFEHDDLTWAGTDTDWHVDLDLDPDPRVQSWDFGFQGFATVDGTARLFQCEVAVAPYFSVTYEDVCRYPGRTRAFDGYDDLFYEMTWRRDSLQYLPSPYTRYRLYRETGEGIPYQVPITGTSNLHTQAFADVLTGWRVDDRDDATPTQLTSEVDPLGVENPWCDNDPAPIDAEEDGLLWEGDTDDPEDGPEDGDASTGFERFIYGMTRYRNILGHPYVDDYEGFKDGMEWRYLRQRNDFYGLCERGPQPNHREAWTEQCCVPYCEDWSEDHEGECDPEHKPALVPRTDVYFNVYAPVDGVVYLVPDPGDVAPCRCESGGDTDVVEDECTLCSKGSLPEESEDTDVDTDVDTDTTIDTDSELKVLCIPDRIVDDNFGAGATPMPHATDDTDAYDTDPPIPCSFNDGVPRKATKLPYPSMNLLVVNHQGNVAFRLLHVESCLENGTVVTAGQRVGRGSAWMEFDLEVWINSERDRWRAVPYFELLPDALYRIYVAKFGLAPRGSGLPRDPIIPLEQRDACPGLPVDDQPGEDTDTPLKHPDPATPILGCEPHDFESANVDTDTDVEHPGDLPTCPWSGCSVGEPATCVGTPCEEENDTDVIPGCPCTTVAAEISGIMPACEGWGGCDPTGDNPELEDCTCSWQQRSALPRCVVYDGVSYTQPACPAEIILRPDLGGVQ